MVACKIAFWFIFGHNEIHHCHRVLFPLPLTPPPPYYSLMESKWKQELRQNNLYNLYNRFIWYDQEKNIATNNIAQNTESNCKIIFNNFHLCCYPECDTLCSVFFHLPTKPRLEFYFLTDFLLNSIYLSCVRAFFMYLTRVT